MADPVPSRIEVRDLTLMYGTETVLDALSLPVPRGKVTVLAGPNGCGKSTLLRAVRRLHNGQKGQIFLDGVDIASLGSKDLARQIGRKLVTPCAPDVAQKHTGYLVGGTSPFGTRKNMPVFLERTIAALDRIYINGGRRGFLIALAPHDLIRVLAPTPVDVAVARTGSGT